MAAGTDATILAALLDHLAVLTFSPALEIAMPGISFTPPVFDADGPDGKKGQPKPYLRVAFLPNQTRTITLADAAQQHRGLLQVSVYWKSGAGLVKPLEAAGKIIDHFAKDTALHSSGVKIRIDRKPWAASPIQEDDRVQIPISIPFHAFA